MNKLKTVLCSYLVAGSLAAACYDPKEPRSEVKDATSDAGADVSKPGKQGSTP